MAVSRTSGFRRSTWRETFRRAEPPSRAPVGLHGPAGTVSDRLMLAVTPGARARGLLGRPPLRDGEGLLIWPCSQVHTLGMRYAIDAVFCDPDLTVVAVETLPPGRVSRLVRGAKVCIELPAGAAAARGVRQGTVLQLCLEAGGGPA